MSVYTTLVLMLMAFLSSLALYLQPGREMYLRFFPPFLFLCCIAEMTSVYLALHNRSNLNFYNVYTILVCCYYYLTIYWIIDNPKVKRVILCILVLYPLVSLLNIIFIQKTTSFHTITYSLGCLIVVALCIYYFFELFQLTRTGNLLRQPAFWICSGLLFYYSCTFPLYGVTNIVPVAVVRNLMIVFQLLDVLLYLSFTIAFLCRLRVRKSTL
jgi:hypothetical protein